MEAFSVDQWNTAKWIRLRCLLSLWVIFINIGRVSTAPVSKSLNFTIGAILVGRDARSSGAEALQLGIDFVNSRSDILPGVVLSLKVHTINSNTDRFGALQAVCRVLQNASGVGVIVGPMSSMTVKAANPVCAGLAIPHIAPVATDPVLSLGTGFPLMIKMTPPDSVQSQALLDLVQTFRWGYVVVIHSGTDYGRNGLQVFVDRAVEAGLSVARIESFSIHRNANRTKATITRSLRRVKESGVRIIILHSHLEVGMLVLHQARNMQMFQTGYTWIVTDGMTQRTGHITQNNHDTTCNDRSAYLADYPGLIGTSPRFGQGKLLRDLKHFSRKKEVDIMSTVMVDSVLTVAYALKDYLSNGSTLQVPSFPQGICRNGAVEQWSQGSALFEYMRKVKGDGTQKYIDFTETNSRRDTSYDILNMQNTGWSKIGTWQARGNLTLTGQPIFSSLTNQVPQDIVLDIEKMTIRIVSVEDEPFVMYSSKTKAFSGFCKDLGAAIKGLLKINNFTVRMSPDGMYGALDPKTRKWNGIIGELVEGRADVGLASLTINSHREEVVDFTTPFLDVGLDTLLPRTDKHVSIFELLQAFDMGTWLALLVATYTCGVFMTACSFLSPFGYRGRYKQRRDAVDLKYQEQAHHLRLDNGIWFAFASFLNQSPDRYPASMSGRMLAFTWWTIVTVTIAFYIANLTALLTVDMVDTGISSVDDLAAQSKIRYGTQVGSSHETFFRTTQVEPYHKMLREMMDRYNTWVPDTREGVARVQRQAQDSTAAYKYAMMMDSAYVEYWSMMEPCVTRAMKNPFMKQGYGLAFRKGSPLTDIFSAAILQLRESGFIAAIYSKWITGPCPQESAAAQTFGGETIPYSRAKGAFYIFFIGLALGLFTVVIEYGLAAYADVIMDKMEGVNTRLSWKQHVMKRVQATYLEAKESLAFVKHLRAIRELKHHSRQASESQDGMDGPCGSQTQACDPDDASQAFDHAAPIREQQDTMGLEDNRLSARHGEANDCDTHPVDILHQRETKQMTYTYRKYSVASARMRSVEKY